jgi:hypothetical protein
LQLPQADIYKRSKSRRARAGAAVALSRVMKTNNLVKWLASLALVATAAGVLSGCYVDTGRRHYYHRPVVIVR